MTHRFGRLRRSATATVVGVTMLGTMSLVEIVGGTPAFAATSSLASGASIVAQSAPPIVDGATNQAAGNWTVNFTAGDVLNTGDTIQISVAPDSPGAGSITFDHEPTITPNTGTGDSALCDSSTGCTVTGAGTSTLTITLTGPSLTTQGAIPANESLTIGSSGSTTDVGYTTSSDASPGPVVVTGTLYTGATDDGSFTTGTAAANADVNNSTSEQLFADSTPSIAPGTTAAAGPFTVTLGGASTQFVSGDKIYITVARNNGINCETAGKPDSVGFSGTPTVTVKAAQNGATTAPTLTAALAQATGSSCVGASGVDNELVLTFTNSGTITGSGSGDSPSTAPVTITVSGLSYVVSGDTTSAGSSAAYASSTNLLGNVVVSSGYNTPPAFTSSTGGSVADDVLTCVDPNYPTGGQSSIETASNPGGSACGSDYTYSGPSNADIGLTALTVVGNSPATTISYDRSATGSELTGQSISNVTINEGTPGALGGGVTGYACLALGGGTEFDGTPTVTATGGGLAVGNVQLLTPGGQAGPTELAFQVTTASSGTAGTVTIAGIKVNVPTTYGPSGAGAFGYGANNASDACTQAADALSGDTVPGGTTGTQYSKNGLNTFTVYDSVDRVYGDTADDTAAAEFALDSPACDTYETSPLPTTAAVLVTDASYYDALSAAYLAGQLDTGTLLTPTDSLSTAALNALRQDGTTAVYVVGGPLAVSQADITQLEATPVYNCDGTVHTSVTGQTQYLTVHQIYGETADDTAEQVATFNGASAVGTADFPAAYGSKQYNDTTGSSGTAAASAPDTPVSTAIVVQDHGFQDAASGSVVAVGGSAEGSASGNGFPILLTPTASLSSAAEQGLIDDAIQQVIVLGGPDAVSDNVVSQIEALGISVIRIAGEDYTDTSQLLAQFELNSVNTAGSADGLNWNYDTAYPYLAVARGDSYTDSITAGPLEGRTPLLLTLNTSSAGNYLPTFLKQVGQTGPYDPGNTPPDILTINNLEVIGGPLAITPSLLTTITTDLNG